MDTRSGDAAVLAVACQPELFLWTVHEVIVKQILENEALYIVSRICRLALRQC